MMMESALDPFESLFSDEFITSNANDLFLNDEIMLGDFNHDSSSSSPTCNALNEPDANLDIDMFQKFLDQLMSSESSFSNETQFDLPPFLESEPATREIGTDPMVEATPSQPMIIQTTHSLSTAATAKTYPFLNGPIILIQSSNASSTPTMVSHIVNQASLTPSSAQLMNSSMPLTEYSMEAFESMTPSSSGESADDGAAPSPDASSETNQSSMITNLNASSKTGPLVLTNEELKLIKQEGYTIPTKFPLSKTEEKMLKRVQRKIKNKISAQESRRKKKEYVDELEKQIAKYITENSALKERVTVIEKNQKSLAKERDLLRSMMGKGTPAPSTALMVFAVFFAVLYGVWSPITSKSPIHETSLSQDSLLMLSNKYPSALNSQQSQQEPHHSNYVSDSYKSRVLLSIDENDHHHGPYLPSSGKPHSSSASQSVGPGYIYASNVEKYMNKRTASGQLEHGTSGVKRPFADESTSGDLTEGSKYKQRRSEYQINENVVMIDGTYDSMDSLMNNESKTMKIIRVERTTPAVGNDTLKLAQRSANE